MDVISGREDQPDRMDDPQVVRPHVDRMDDLQCNPRLLAEWEEQERRELERQKRIAQRQAAAAQKPRPTGVPQTQTHLPQMSAAQRRANQADQPREHDGKYAEKPASKWRHYVTGEPALRTSLKKVRKPARSSARPPTPRSKSKRAKLLPSMQSMMEKPFHQKVGWVVRRWFRRKKKHLRALFSWKG